MHFSTLTEWLNWISSVHITDIDLTIERVKTVATRLNLLHPQGVVIIVGGTNGKGSTVAGLDAIYRAAGYKVGTFTSPILFKHNEQVKVNGVLASDEDFCNAFSQIENARGDITLTPFEFHTLAALLIFQTHPLDVLILEVGLGGRLDATNILEPDIAVITSIGIDHTEWLGSTREAIAGEKAGIFREKKPVVCGDFNPPTHLIDRASQLNAPFYCQGQDFFYHENETNWSFTSGDLHYDHLPLTMLATQNMSIVLMVITLLQKRLPVTRKEIDKGLSQVTLSGRIQIIKGPVTEIYDVSHNQDAVSFLAKKLEHLPIQGKIHAVFSMLADKNIVESITAINKQIYRWYVAPLEVKRAATMSTLMQAFRDAQIQEAYFFPTILEAYKAAQQSAIVGDFIIIFGSFHTVADVWQHRTE